MIKKLSGLTAALFLCANIATAQVANYTFSQSIGSYGSTNTGTVIGSPGQDDDVNTVALPFPFVYNGTSYSSVEVASNGCLSFSSMIGDEWTPLSDGTTQELISALGNDLLAAVGITGDVTAGSNTITNCSFTSGLMVGDELDDFWSNFSSNPIITNISGNDIEVNQNALFNDPGAPLEFFGSIFLTVSGTAPNRVTTFEYRNFCRWTENESLKFKINLYETTNKVEFVYGDMYADANAWITGNEVGLKGTSNTDFNGREVSLSNSWSTSNASTVISDICDLTDTFVPVVGQTYAWTPPVCVTPTLTASQSPAVTCPSASVVLLASGATSYTWTGGPSAAQYTVNPLTTTNYTLIGANGACTSSTVITHSVAPNPTVTISSSVPQSCAGANVTLLANGATDYVWTNGPPTTQYAVSPGVTTSYTVTGSTAPYNCSSTAVITLTVNPYPVLAITQTSASICQGQTATLTVTGGASYMWNNGQTTAQIAVSPSATAVYSLTGTTAGCTSTASITQNVTICTGLEDISLANITSVFPNPFRSELNLNNGGSADLTVTISDALGKTIYTTTVRGNSNESIQTDFLVNGIYLLKLNDGTNTVTKKIVKN